MTWSSNEFIDEDAEPGVKSSREPKLSPIMSGKASDGTGGGKGQDLCDSDHRRGEEDAKWGRLDCLP